MLQLLIKDPTIWLMKITPGGSGDTKMYFENLFINEGCKNLIGYTKEDGKIEAFALRWNNIGIGDLVIVIEGANRVFGVVEIRSEPWNDDNMDKEADWFFHRRSARLIKYFEPYYVTKASTNRDTIIEYSGDGAMGIIDEVWDIIKKEYLTLKWNELMEKSRIDETKKQQLQQLWRVFQNRYGNDQKNEIVKQYQALLDDWKVYGDKLAKNDFHLEDFANRMANNTGLSGGYLCNFLERTTRRIFGSSRPGNAYNYGIKKNDDAETYSIKDGSSIGLEQARRLFSEDFLPLLKQITEAATIDQKIDAIERSNVIPAKQLLLKMLVLQHPSQFINIYSTHVIDRLFEEFTTDDGQASTATKNRLLCAILSDALEVNTEEPIQQFLLSRFLWEYSRTRSIVDDNDPNVILYGAPGTGKTYQVSNDLNFVTRGDSSSITNVQFHPSYTYEDFIEGIKPKGIGPDGNIRFELVNGLFKNFCIKAKNHPDKHFYFVVDEINRANLSAVFGEVLFCMEKTYRRRVRFASEADQEEYRKTTHGLLKTQYASFIEQLDPSKRKELAFEEINGEVYFGIPENVYFIGMMNDVDKSIDTFDLALRRRFKWIRKECDYEVISDHVKQPNEQPYENIEEYLQGCQQLNHFIAHDLGLGSSYEFGHAFFLKIQGLAARRRISPKNIDDLFNQHLKPTLKEYLRAFFTETELDTHLVKALEHFKSAIRN